MWTDSHAASVSVPQAGSHAGSDSGFHAGLDSDSQADSHAALVSVPQRSQAGSGSELHTLAAAWETLQERSWVNWCHLGIWQILEGVCASVYSDRAAACQQVVGVSDHSDKGCWDLLSISPIVVEESPPHDTDRARGMMRRSVGSGFSQGSFIEASRQDKLCEISAVYYGALPKRALQTIKAFFVFIFFHQH